MRLEQPLLTGAFARAEQLAVRGHQEWRQFRGTAIAIERVGTAALKLEGMAELEMHVSVGRSARQRRSVYRLSLLQPPGVLQHVAVLDADVVAGRLQRDCSPVSLRRSCIVARIAPAISVADMGFTGLVRWRLHRRILGHPEGRELG